MPQCYISLNGVWPVLLLLSLRNNQLTEEAIRLLVRGNWPSLELHGIGYHPLQDILKSLRGSSSCFLICHVTCNASGKPFLCVGHRLTNAHLLNRV